MTTYSFEVDHAVEYGIDEAIMIYNLRHWIEVNAANKRNFKDGRTWTYNSQEALTIIFPFWSRDQIKRTIKRLIEKEIILTANYNDNPYDKTTWFTFKDEQKFIRQQFISKFKQDEKTAQSIGRNRPIDEAESPDRLGGIAQCSNTDIKPNIKHNIKQERGGRTPSLTQNLSKKIERAEGVSTSEEEHRTLVDKHGEEFAAACYEELSEWKKSAPPGQVKKHQSDYLRINKWVAPALKERQIKEQELALREQKLKGSKPQDPENKEDPRKRFEYANDYIASQGYTKCKNGRNLRDESILGEKCIKIGNDVIYYNDPKFYKLFEHSIKKITG